MKNRKLNFVNINAYANFDQNIPYGFSVMVKVHNFYLGFASDKKKKKNKNDLVTINAPRRGARDECLCNVGSKYLIKFKSYCQFHYLATDK